MWFTSHVAYVLCGGDLIPIDGNRTDEGITIVTKVKRKRIKQPKAMAEAQSSYVLPGLENLPYDHFY